MNGNSKEYDPWSVAVTLGSIAVALLFAMAVWEAGAAHRPGIAATSNATPVALISKSHLNVGTVTPGELLKDCVMVRNPGIIPLRFLTGTTGCRAPHPVRKRMTVAPGGQAGIDVEIDSNAEPGTYTHEFSIHTDDPHNRRIQVTMTYTVVFSERPERFD